MLSVPAQIRTIHVKDGLSVRVVYNRHVETLSVLSVFNFIRDYPD